MLVTFVDSCVIIAASSGTKQELNAAWEILTDPDRELWTSPFVQMEVLPHAERQGTPKAIAVCRGFFGTAKVYANLEEIVRVAAAELRETNLGLADALHLAAAHLSHADEFITTEKLSKPMHRNTLVKVTRLRT